MTQEQPWLNEPDYIKWIDQDTGYHCVISRTPQILNLCGYVRVPRSHALYRKDYDGGKARHIEVHGGLTYSGGMRRLSGAPVRGFWIGFDCAHYMDLAPGFLSLAPNLPPLGPQTYRDVAYVRTQTTMLAKQLKAMEK